VLYFSLVVVTVIFVFRVLCFNIYNVFVDSTSKGGTAVVSVSQSCRHKARFTIVKKNRTAFSNFRTSLYHKMTAT
jgi:hypothetical protein